VTSAANGDAAGGISITNLAPFARDLYVVSDRGERHSLRVGPNATTRIDSPNPLPQRDSSP
jgi:hypothetical protein